MFPLQPLRSFLPIDNALGFGPADFLELAIAALLVFFALVSRPWIEPYARRLAPRTAWCMLLLAALPVALRLLLLPNHPVPTPDIYDEFGHLLVADTLRHFRLANPPHSLPQFFETFFVLQRPTYSSIYPIGQGIALAIGWTIFGSPWSGVVLATAAFCALCYWMLRAWTTPLWSLIGGLLAVIEFGPLNQWMNDYWGGAFIAVSGCLVFGALPRLAAAPRERDASLLGLGLAIHLLTRPYESIFLLLAVALYFLPLARRPDALRALAKMAPATLLIVAAALGVTLLQNKQVTGSWTTLPYQLSQYQYGVPAALTFQPNPVPHADLTPEQQMDYRMQRGFHGSNMDTLSTYLLRLEYRVRYYRFFFLAPLYLALPLFLISLRRLALLWVAVTLVVFTLGINFFPAYQLHYAAACTCLYILVAITGLQRLSAIRIHGRAAGRGAARILLFLCAAHFVFWYSLHLFEHSSVSQALLPYETWDAINHLNPQRRILVNQQLERIPGQLLVFVRYTYPPHAFQDEWVYNRADIDGGRVVWARDLGPEEDRKLLEYYPQRKALLLEPDVRPPQLNDYQRP
jgi:hypothetical protein